jgi:tRNA1(Val) A37 N6-methylase TrmN6
MRELVRTNNAVLVTAIDALLKGADIPHQLLDQNMSVLEGSLGILPRRILVDDDRYDEARRILEDAGLAHELRPLPAGQVADTTDDAVLGGRLRLIQQKRGHRVGHDAILLAAATGARTGDHVVDLGAGVGAAGLALATRKPEATVTLVEIDPALAALADKNIERNGLKERARVAVLDVAGPRDAFAAAGLEPGSADRVMMNPPFNDLARQNVSPDVVRAAAHSADPDLLSDWIATASWLLHSAGALTMIWRADGLANVLKALPSHFGAIAILPVHGSAGQPAIRVIIRTSKASHAPLALLPGLMLTDANGRPTVEAERVLRHAESLAMPEI